MVPMTNLIPTPYISGLKLGPKSFQIQIIAASAATAATPTAESASEAKPTISAIIATKIQKLIPIERIPPVPMFKRGHEACGGIVPPQLTHCLWGEHPFGESESEGETFKKV
jgi:hypothetical protein